MFRPFEDRWSPNWLRYMIFLPIALLQMLNLFWYFLILRIMFRYVLLCAMVRQGGRCVRVVMGTALMGNEHQASSNAGVFCDSIRVPEADRQDAHDGQCR